MSEVPFTSVEFYRNGGELIGACRASSVPREGEFVNIEGEMWEVIGVTWDLDMGRPLGEELRANVEMAKYNDR